MLMKILESRNHIIFGIKLQDNPHQMTELSVMTITQQSTCKTTCPCVSKHSILQQDTCYSVDNTFILFLFFLLFVTTILLNPFAAKGAKGAKEQAM